MTDQNQPKLSLEEELDVLEAVYKIGKEKGLELLRPEQVKKLRDGGRFSVKKDNKIDRPADIAKIDYYINLIVDGLLIDVEKLARQSSGEDSWIIINEEARKKIVFSYFVSTYGLSPATIRNELMKNIMKKRIHA